MKTRGVILFSLFYFFVAHINTIVISTAAPDIDQDVIECPKKFQSSFCTCSLLQLQKVGIFCEKEADSLEKLITSILALSGFLIDTLVITNTPIHKLKSNAFGPLKVRRIVLSNNSLTELQANCFTGPLLDSLEELEISSNRLTIIPTHGIADLKALKSLVLSNNLIELDLSANQLNSIGQQALLGLERLRRLSLDKNYFKKIPTDAIGSLAGSLEELWMSVNSIHEVDKEALPLPKLKALSFDVNRISRISGEVFKHTPNLLYLYLSNNVFSEIDPLMFQHINQLKVLSMNYNMLSSLNQQTFQFAPSIVRLELANCFIGSIEDGTFWNVPKSQFISLANNKLRRISQKVFASLPLTVALDLSNNMINQIEDFAFSGLLSLQMLDLSGNQIEKLPPNTFFNTFHANQAGESRHQTSVVARVLNLHENPWNCDQHLLWLVEWLKQNTNIQITSPGKNPTRRPKQYTPIVPQQKWLTTTTDASTAITMLVLMRSSTQEASKFITASTAKRKLAVPSLTSQPKLAAIAETNIAAMILVASIALIGVIALLLISMRVIIKRAEDEELKKKKKQSQSTHPIDRLRIAPPYSSSNYCSDTSKRVITPTCTTHFYGSCYDNGRNKTSSNLRDSYWWF